MAVGGAEMSSSPVLADAKAYHAAGRFTDAAALYLRHFTEYPEDVDHAHLLVQALAHLKNLEQATALCRASLNVHPNSAVLHALYGWYLLKARDFTQSEFHLLAAIRLAPQAVEGWVYLAQWAVNRGMWAKARELNKHALSLNPTHAIANYNQSLCLLRAGRWAEGWRRYEYRWETTGFLSQHQGLPEYRPFLRGANLTDKTVLVYAEQGIGDALQFVRYLPLLKERGARVFLLTGGRGLNPLLEVFADTLGIELLIAPGDLVPLTDYAVPMLSLPHLLRKDEPYNPGPYLLFPTAPRDGFRVGYVWAGSPGHEGDQQRSTERAQWADLLATPDIDWVPLQVGAGGTFTPADWLETALLVGTCDLVITVDTAVAHLAGAMGIDCWMLLPLYSDWRWGEAGDRTPWYDRTRLFRQTTMGAWGPVFEAVAAELVTHIDTLRIGA